MNTQILLEGEALVDRQGSIAKWADEDFLLIPVHVGAVMRKD